jgi:hypothetical protein
MSHRTASYIRAWVNGRQLCTSFVIFLLVYCNPQPLAITIAGAGQAPNGADDIDAFYTVGSGLATEAVIQGRTTIDGNPGASITGQPGGKGKAHWEGAMSGGTVYGWALQLRDNQNAIVTHWYFTQGGSQTGPQYNIPSVKNTTLLASGSGNVSIEISNPNPLAQMDISNFAIFAPQMIAEDPVVFADFSISPFIGAPIAGIPSTFSLAALTSVLFTAQDYPELTGPLGSLVGIQFTLNGSDFRFGYTLATPDAGHTIIPLSLAITCLLLLRGAVSRKPFRLIRQV